MNAHDRLLDEFASAIFEMERDVYDLCGWSTAFSLLASCNCVIEPDALAVMASASCDAATRLKEKWDAAYELSARIPTK